MATEEIRNMDEQGQNLPEDAVGQEAGDGNFFSRYGKIFLIMAVMLGQAGGAYGIVNAYYGSIHAWISSLSTQGGVYHNFENIIINPANSAGENYLILTVAFEMYSESQLAAVEKNSVRIIDQINEILSQRTAGELANLQTRDEIKKEIGRSVNEMLDKKVVRNLFFTKYVLQ